MPLVSALFLIGEDWFHHVAILFLTLLVLYLVSKKLLKKNNLSRNKEDNPASVLIVAGSGGHTREIISLSAALGKHYHPRYYVVADTDQMSREKVEQCESTRETKDKKSYDIFTIPRSREVKQSYITSIFTTLRAAWSAFPLVFKLTPDVILCNGPGTCIPICFAGLLLKILSIKNTHIVYVESFCRVTSMSLSGKILYHFADVIFVQWPELAEKYPKSKYIGRLV